MKTTFCNLLKKIVTHNIAKDLINDHNSTLNEVIVRADEVEIF